LLLKHQLSLWSFLRYDGVPIPNNRAEQCIRPYVIWRKTSFATQSHRGDQFIARILSVVETCNTQARSVHDFLTELFQADHTGHERHSSGGPCERVGGATCRRPPTDTSVAGEPGNK
jgi:transposase